ncbi:MAG: tyrosine-type recombinase/integrase [Candidatus Nealsonbacteria bacterium]|nr:tyrosine-type recombinase/integrase [Candidatus Nealsonbacteria bacterium]
MATVFKRGGRGKRTARYYIAYFDHTGKRQVRSARTTDKATADRIAAKLETDAALRRDGVIDVQLDSICQQAKRTIESHLEDFQAKMVSEDRAARHVHSTINNIRAIAGSEDFVVASDITADGVVRYAGKLRQRGRSARTVHAYLTAIKGFCRWLAMHHKLPRDPLVSVKKPNPNADRRRERRMLLHEEWNQLHATTLKLNAERYGISATERVLLYATAIQTGLRSAELRSLTRGRFFLDVTPPYITCKAGVTKNREDARQYIQSELARRLKQHVGANGVRNVFHMPDNSDVAPMLRADLADARKAWLDDARKASKERTRREESDFLLEANFEGEVLDFHALRHTCGAWLAMTGAHPKTVQTVMRHSSITLTMDTYGHLFPGQEADAISKLPEMLGDPSKSMPSVTSARM